MQTYTITYNDDTVPLEGYTVLSPDLDRPLVLLCHAWNGKDEFICNEARTVASWGYNCFALDVYGKQVVGKTKQECLSLKQPFINDRKALRKRLMLGYHTAMNLPGCDKNQVAVVGFGFGGLCALDMARFGLNLQGAVSVYGHYDPYPERLTEEITAKLLLIQGYEDPVVPLSSLEAFNAEMKLRNAEWNIHLYSNTLHAFMNPKVNDREAGLLYNAISAHQARLDIRAFLGQIFEG